MELQKLSDVSSGTFLRHVMPVAGCVLCFHQTASVTRWDYGWRDRADKLNERFFPVRHRICNADVIAEIKTDVQLYV